MPFSVNFWLNNTTLGGCSCEQLHFPNQIETCDCGCEYLIFIRSRSFEPQVAVVVGDFHNHKSKQSLTQVIWMATNEKPQSICIYGLNLRQ